jgi:hypothetical protein
MTTLDQGQVLPTSAATAADYLKSLDNVEGLIADIRSNLDRANEISQGQIFRELQHLNTQMPIWVRRFATTSHFGFWQQMSNHTRGLVARINAYVVSEGEEPFVEVEIPRRLETSQFRSWGAYSTSDEEEEDVEYLCETAQVEGTPTGIVIPSDLEEVWPKGYNLIQSAAEAYGFSLIKSALSMQRAGFKGAAALSKDKNIATEAMARLTQEEQKSVLTLKALYTFMRLTPNQALSSDAKYTVAASFMLHFLLMTGNAEDDANVAASLKHSDGGRSIIIARVEQLFQTDRAVAVILVAAAERIYRSIARSEKSRHGGIDMELKATVTACCFASPEGMLDKYYITEKREINRMVNEIDRSGRPKLVKKRVLVRGKRVPCLNIGSEMLTSSEKSELRKYEHRFSMPSLAKSTMKSFYQTGGQPERLTLRIRDLVQDAYRVSKMISEAIKSRKQVVRAHAVTAGAQANKITPAQWVSSSQIVMETVTPLPKQVYEEIEGFLRYWESS